MVQHDESQQLHGQPHGEQLESSCSQLEEVGIADSSRRVENGDVSTINRGIAMKIMKILM